MKYPFKQKKLILLLVTAHIFIVSCLDANINNEKLCHELYVSTRTIQAISFESNLLKLSQLADNDEDSEVEEDEETTNTRAFVSTTTTTTTRTSAKYSKKNMTIKKSHHKGDLTYQHNIFEISFILFFIGFDYFL